MMKHVTLCCLALLILLLPETSVAQAPKHVLAAADSVTWGPASPKLPPGAQFAILHGDPTKPGAPYVFRAKLPDGYSVPPHWHTVDENVTVISGVFILGFGEQVDKASMRTMEAGSYVLLPAKRPHYNVVRVETVLQFHGVGPYDIEYVTPLDMPNRERK